MPILLPPLEKMRLTQPFGVDYLGNNGPDGKSYADIGLVNGHNGWDLSCQTETVVYAPMSGTIQCRSENGYGNSARIRSRILGLEIILGHLKGFEAVDGAEVKAGQAVATSDNTGFSTGPHLHLGIRKIRWDASGAGPFVENYDNGYFGYVDPTPFFPQDVFALPVDKQYGLTNQTPGVPSEISWQLTNVWVFKNLKRLLTTREMKALRYGFWDLRTVLDPAMFPIWSEMHKPEAIKRGLVR